MNYTEQIINELLDIIISETNKINDYCTQPYDCNYSCSCQECLLRGIEREIMERNK